MWWPGEDRQEACSLQKLPEAGIRPVAQEQVFAYLLDLRVINNNNTGYFQCRHSRILRCLEYDT